jgi:hypothetical protein
VAVVPAKPDMRLGQQGCAQTSARASIQAMYYIAKNALLSSFNVMY